jgi:TrkA domain protein
VALPPSTSPGPTAPVIGARDERSSFVPSVTEMPVFRHHVVVDVTETLLPGLGIRYEFTTRNSDRVGVIAFRDGAIEIVVYEHDDPDASRVVLRLTEDEADTVAEILGAPRIAERFADLSREIPGLVAAQVKVPEASPYAGRALGDTRARTRTGASVVAIVHGEEVVASPSPAEPLRAGDVLVVIGIAEGIDGVRAILRG